MPTADLNDVLNNLPKYVWLVEGGTVAIDPKLDEALGFNIGQRFRLMECIKNNILYSGGRTRRGEFIDYAGAVRDFRKAKDGLHLLDGQAHEGKPQYIGIDYATPGAEKTVYWKDGQAYERLLER